MSDNSKDRAPDAPTNVQDVVDTLNRLARACTDCGTLARRVLSSGECTADQRYTLLSALPIAVGWDATAETLRGMADRVAALEAEVARLRGGA